MDVTPTPAMFRAMSAIVDVACGEAPGKFEKTPAAERRREARTKMFDTLHRFVALTMREGVRRHQQELGAQTQAATSIQVATSDDKPVPQS